MGADCWHLNCLVRHPSPKPICCRQWVRPRSRRGGFGGQAAPPLSTRASPLGTQQPHQLFPRCRVGASVPLLANRVVAAEVLPTLRGQCPLGNQLQLGAAVFVHRPGPSAADQWLSSQHPTNRHPISFPPIVRLCPFTAQAHQLPACGHHLASTPSPHQPVLLPTMVWQCSCTAPAHQLPAGGLATNTFQHNWWRAL